MTRWTRCSHCGYTTTEEEACPACGTDFDDAAADIGRQAEVSSVAVYTIHVGQLTWAEVVAALCHGHSRCPSVGEDEIAIATSSFGEKWFTDSPKSHPGFVADSDGLIDGWWIIRKDDALEIYLRSCHDSELDAVWQPDGTWSIRGQFPMNRRGEVESHAYWPPLRAVAGIAEVPDPRIRQIMAGDIPAMIRATERGITPADLTRHWPRWCVNCESIAPCYCGHGAYTVPAVPLAGSGVHVAVDPIAEAMAEALLHAEEGS